MALYEFCDTTEIPGDLPLPAEALSYDGVWIDDEIPFYRTLYVSGRESFSYDIAELAMDSMDGSAFLRRRLLPRTITVGYQLSAPSAEAFRTAFNHLARLMSVQQARIIFADEPEKFYIGTCRSIGIPEPGRLAVKAEMEIYCPDPCKYDVEETVYIPNSQGVFSIEYEGSFPVRPTLTVEFGADAKQVVFTGEDAVISAGDADSASAIFVSGDVLKVDCDSGEIYLNSTRTPELGDIANGYEKMLLAPGTNLITPSLAGSGSPAYTARYRTAWL